MHTTRDEIWFEADELKLRYVLLNLFHEDWDYGATENAYYGFDFLDGALLSLLTKNVSKILFRFGIVMDDPTLVSLELTLAIMHYRVLKGHPFPDYLPLPDGSSPESAATQALFELVEAHTRYIYPMPERARIREMIATGRFVPAEGLNDPAALTIKQTAICYLAEIDRVFGVDFSADSTLLCVLERFLRQLLAGNSIFSQHQNIRAIKETLAAEYEFAYLFQRYAQDFMHRYLSEIELSSLWNDFKSVS